MRKTLGACLLVLLLSGATVAGEMPNLSPAIAPQPAGVTQEPTDDTTLNGVPGVSDSLTGLALDLLAVLPSLL